MFYVFYTNEARNCITQMPVEHSDVVSFPDLTKINKAEAIELAASLGYVVEEQDDGSLLLTNSGSSL